MQHHGYDTPGVYSMCSASDQFIFHIGLFLSTNRGTPLTKELIADSVPSDFEYKDISIIIITKVLTELDLFDKILPSREFKQAAEQYTSISVPKVNRIWPILL